jgi:hypothetical protein
LACIPALPELLTDNSYRGGICIVRGREHDKERLCTVVTSSSRCPEDNCCCDLVTQACGGSTDEEETERPMVGNNSIHGKNKRKVHFRVGKMDKHIIQGDEVVSDDDSYDASYDDNLVRHYYIPHQLE